MTDAMSCTALDDRLAEYLEGDLGPADYQAVRAHLASCVRCAALVRDVEQIRADAGQMPALAPSRDLWEGIAARIETPIVPLAPRTTPNVVVRQRGIERLRLAAVAAALVAVTAGVTYTLTVSRGANGSGEVAIVAPDSASDSALSPKGSVLEPAAEQTLAERDSAAGRAPRPRPLTESPDAQSVGNSSDAATSSREIDRLRSTFLRNRAQLDPRTAAIIETNLKVIDDAIAQSKAALEQDPASRFLSNQLNSALGKKLELLRTAALLPNRT